MKKLISIFLLSLMFININVKAEELNIKSENVILYNLKENKILLEKNSDERIKVASLTKIMTIIVALENTQNLDEQIIVTSQLIGDTSGFAVAGFKIGEKITIRDLLYGAMLPSGADATNILSKKIAGSEKNFVNLMNEKAISLNLTNTHFENVTGIDEDNHYSSVKDISKLLMYALNNETFKEIYTTKTYTTSDKALKLSSTLLKNSVSYNLNTEFITGSKTGFTDGAGLCMSSIATINDIPYMLITAKAPTTGYPYQVIDAINIYKYYGANYSYKELLKENEEIAKIKIKNGKEDFLIIKSKEDVYSYLKNDIKQEDIKIKFDGINIITNKNKLNDKLGTISITYEQELLYTLDVYLETKIKYKIITLPRIMIAFVIFIIISLLTKIKKRKRHKRKRMA